MGTLTIAREDGSEVEVRVPSTATGWVKDLADPTLVYRFEAEEGTIVGTRYFMRRSTGRPGDILAAALAEAGIRMVSRSRHGLRETHTPRAPQDVWGEAMKRLPDAKPVHAKRLPIPVHQAGRLYPLSTMGITCVLRGDATYVVYDGEDGYSLLDAQFLPLLIPKNRLMVRRLEYAAEDLTVLRYGIEEPHIVMHNDVLAGIVMPAIPEYF